MNLSVSRPFTLTEQERSLLPSDSDAEFYAEHGWYLSKKVLTDGEADELLAASERYYAGERDRILPVRPPGLAYWDPLKGDVQRYNDYVHYEHDDLARLLRKPLIGAVAAALARAGEIRVFQSTLIYKPPIAAEPTNIVPWHFDKHYWSTSTSLHLQDGENAYRPFVLSTGEILAYNHDILVRRLPDGRPGYADPDFCPVVWHNPARTAGRPGHG